MTLFALLLLFLQGNRTFPQSVDRNAFTFTEYKLAGSIDPAHHAIAVEGDVTLRNDSAQSQSAAALQISSSLEWKQLSVNGQIQRIAPARLDSDIDHTGAITEVIVGFTPVAPKQSVTVHVKYQGTVELGSGRLRALGTPQDVAEQNDWDRVGSDITALRGVGYVHWYPVSMEPARLGDKNVVFTRIADWKSRHQDSSMSLQLNIKGGADATLLSSAHEQHALNGTYDLGWNRFGIHVPVILIGKYTATATTMGTVFSLGSTNDTAAKYSSALSTVRPQEFESAKPIAPIKLVQVPSSFTPFEADHLLLTPFPETAGDQQVRANLAHLAAHAYFRSNRAWLDEGYAHYAQLAWTEKVAGKEAALKSIAQRSSTLDIFDSGENEAQQPLTQARDELFYRTKASFVLRMLRDMVGESPFARALQEYSPERDREPSYFQRLVEDHAKRDLEPFFDDWVYRDRGLPEFKVTDLYSRQNLNGGYLVTVSLENTGHAGAEVPVTVRAGSGVENSGRVWVAARSKASIRLALPTTPETATVNDGSVPESDPTNNTFTPGTKQ